MKVTVLQENLAHGLNIVSRAVSTRSTLPVLGNVLVATDEGRLRLSATNLELGITCWIGAKIEEEGSTTVPARTFTELVGTLSPYAGLTDQQVDLTLNVRTQTLNVHCGASNTDLKCIDSQEFPPMPSPEIADGVQIGVADFKEMIQQVAFAASTDEARPILTGVLVTVSPFPPQISPTSQSGAAEARSKETGYLTLAAADGFRLSVRKTILPGPPPRPVSAIIPARALTELARITGAASPGSEASARGEGDSSKKEREQTITMHLPPGRGQVIFRWKDVELVSQLIEGNFPDFEQIIPRTYKTRTVVSTAAFLKACKQAEIFAREGSHIARLNIYPPGSFGRPTAGALAAGDEASPKGATPSAGESIGVLRTEGPGSLVITGQSEETGSSQTEIPATVEGAPLLIAFNVRYLREVLEVIKTPEVALETTMETSPGLIRPVGEDNFVHVIMPMHLGS